MKGISFRRAQYITSNRTEWVFLSVVQSVWLIVSKWHNYEGVFGQCDVVDDDVNDDIGDDVNDDVHDTDNNGDVPHLLHVRPLSSAALALE